jgi:porin
MSLHVLPKAKLRFLSRFFFAGLLLLGTAGVASPQPYPLPPTWGGDVASRPRLTGDWGGLRDELGQNGVVFDLDLLLTPQTVLSGGRNVSSDFWGNVDYTLNLDTQKLGLWPGGFFKFQADTGFGSNAFRDSGALVPINTAALIPGPNDRTTALMNATLTQFFGADFAVFGGKINTADSGGGEFYSDYRTQFENNLPLTLEQVPTSTFGGGIIGTPREDITLSVTALGPNGTSDSNDPKKAFDGVLLLGTSQLNVTPFGLLGHQSVTVSWDHKKQLSLNQDPSNLAALLLQERFPRLANPGPVLRDILTQFFPELLVPARPANHTSSSWAMSYAFDQYLWQPDGNPHHGLGLFFAFAASDGNPNPIQYSFLAGIGANGMVPGRPDDNFGMVLARSQFSSEFLPFLRQQLDLGLQHEDVIEVYYNAAITPWLNLSTDMQIVNPGLKKAPNMAGRLAAIETAVIMGSRLRVRF